jgi:hypothetical protein
MGSFSSATHSKGVLGFDCLFGEGSFSLLLSLLPGLGAEKPEKDDLAAVRDLYVAINFN